MTKKTYYVENSSPQQPFTTWIISGPGKTIREHIRLQLYKTLVKPVLMYNSQTWGLTVNDEHNLDSFHCQQLRTALHIKFPHVISNKDLFQQTNRIPLTLTILKNRWKIFGHILRLLPQTPAQQSIRHYFLLSQNSGSRGTQRITLPITLDKDLVRASERFNFGQRYIIQQFQSLQDLDRLIKLGHDRQLWKHLCNDIFEVAQADWSPDHEAGEHYHSFPRPS